MLEFIIGCTIYGAFIMLSFIVGLHYGSKLKHDEDIKMPNINPIKIIKEAKEESMFNEKLKKEQEIMKINLENIENYDGTGLGQREFPR